MDQPVRPLQVDGQVLNLPLYVRLTDNFRSIEPYFEIFVLNLVTFTGGNFIFLNLVDGQFWAHSNIRTYKKIVKNYGDVYRLTDTPFTCEGLRVEVKLRENVTAGPKIVRQPVKVSRFML